MHPIPHDSGSPGVPGLFLESVHSPEVHERQAPGLVHLLSGAVYPLHYTFARRWLDREANGEFDAFMLSWVGNIDPDDFYYAQHHTGANFNFQGYSNSEVDSLLDQARVETDQAARKDLYDQAAKIIVDEASYIYLYNPDNINAWRNEVGGYMTRGDKAVRFVETTLSQ